MRRCRWDAKWALYTGNANARGAELCEAHSAANAPSALAVTKYQLYLDWHRDVASSVHFSEQRINTMSRSRDYKEGVAAYLEGRAPVWENH